MAIDIYAWLTYRLSYLRYPTVISWNQIKGQIGAGYPDTPRGMRNFRQKFLGALDRVLSEWTSDSIRIMKNGTMLTPGAPSIPRRTQDELQKHFSIGDDPLF